MCVEILKYRMIETTPCRIRNDLGCVTLDSKCPKVSKNSPAKSSNDSVSILWMVGCADNLVAVSGAANGLEGVQFCRCGYLQ